MLYLEILNVALFVQSTSMEINLKNIYLFGVFGNVEDIAFSFDFPHRILNFTKIIIFEKSYFFKKSKERVVAL